MCKPNVLVKIRCTEINNLTVYINNYNFYKSLMAKVIKSVQKKTEQVYKIYSKNLISAMQEGEQLVKNKVRLYRSARDRILVTVKEYYKKSNVAMLMEPVVYLNTLSKKDNCSKLKSKKLCLCLSGLILYFNTTVTIHNVKFPILHIEKYCRY